MNTSAQRMYQAVLLIKQIILDAVSVTLLTVFISKCQRYAQALNIEAVRPSSLKQQ